MLDEATYNQMAASAFRRILDAVDEIDPDLIDAESTGDMVTLTSDRGEKCVVNTQRAVRQIWVAGNGQGIHFSYHPSSRTWVDDKGKGLELFTFVADVVEALTGERLQYR
jgi:CyaY protein